MFYNYRPYVSVAQRRANAKKDMDKLRKKGANVQPIEIEGRTIARTFWGKAWCSHLEGFSDYSNRLPRGRTYVRNGSVCHLEVQKGLVKAIVSGSELYNITIKISPLRKPKWTKIQIKCAGEIGSILELLQGKISSGVMSAVTNDREGLFPQSNEIDLNCDCPDSAYMCKHIAAVLYGVGARLDHSPELLFLLRNVNYEDLITADIAIPTGKTGGRKLKGDLSALFDVDVDLAIKPKRPVKKISDTKAVNKPAKRSSSKAKTKAKVKTKIKVNVDRKVKKLVKKANTPTLKKPKAITAAAIKRLRKSLELNNTQFSKLLMVSPSTVKNWELKTGKLNLRDSNRERICLILAMSREDALKLL